MATSSTVLVMDLPQVFAHRRGISFAAVRHDGSVVTWGHAAHRGNSEPVKSELQSGIDRVVGTSYAFAAVKQDGSVVTWGNECHGGSPGKVWDQLIDGVRHVAGTKYAFAAVKKDGSVVTWGAARGGGKSDNVKSELTGGVDHVVGTQGAFAALKQDGSVVTWGQPLYGGNSDSVRDQLTCGVRDVAGGMGAFAAVREDGSVVTWEISQLLRPLRLGAVRVARRRASDECKTWQLEASGTRLFDLALAVSLIPPNGGCVTVWLWSPEKRSCTSNVNVAHFPSLARSPRLCSEGQRVVFERNE